jgi:hypothetical protein
VSADAWVYVLAPSGSGTSSSSSSFTVLFAVFRWTAVFAKAATGLSETAAPPCGGKGGHDQEKYLFLSAAWLKPKGLPHTTIT